MLFANAMAYVNNAIITRTLGADSYGLYVLATNVLNYAVIISGFGFGVTTVRFVSFYAGKEDFAKIKGTIWHALKTVLFFSAVISLLLFILSPQISVGIFHRHELVPLLRILLFSLPFAILSVVLLSALTGIKQIKYKVIASNILMPLLFFVMVVVIFIMGFRLTALIWVTMLLGMTGFLIAFYFINKKLLTGIKAVKPEVEKKKLWRFSLPMYFNNLMDKTKMFIPIFLIGYFLSNEDIGVYNISFKIALMVSFSLGAFRDIFSPSISSLFAKGKIKLIEDLYKTVTKWEFSISLLSFFVIMLLAKQLLNIFGKDFIAGTNILIILIFSELLNAGGGLARSIIVMSGRPKVVLFNSGVTILLIFALCYFLIPEYGITGSAISYLITMTVLNTMRIAELYFFEKIHPFKLNYYKPVVSGLAAYFILYFALKFIHFNPYLEILLGSFIFVALFAGFIRLLKADPEDKYILKMIVDKLKQIKN